MSSSFEKIAILNRGEAAMRLLYTTRDLVQQGSSIQTVALYTEPDRDAKYVRLADDCYCLGSATYTDVRTGQKKSRYLDYALLERALRDTGADAVWVGWGFVSEQAEFAELCRLIGVTFIGPSVEAMRALGDKITSKRIAEMANVPVAPWSGGPVRTVEVARSCAEQIGYPVMLKATAGGGGRGVRRVNCAGELGYAFESAQNEALRSFGDNTVFLERAIVGARHVEVQILGDRVGTIWSLGTRDCSVQRRNQKVLEEAPCAFLSPLEDQRLRESARAIASAAKYENAGTVEFLFDAERREFFFMEMNARLQVEHPVTEAVTGVDLVKMQLHIAQGGLLASTEPVIRGHAIEVRLNAENPDADFCPAPGLVELLRFPTGPGLRVDSGFEEGDRVSAFFDSMLAKVIASGGTRDEAIACISRGLKDTAVLLRGGATNKGFLLNLLKQPVFCRGEVDIGWIDRSYPWPIEASRQMAAIACFVAAVEVWEERAGQERTRFLSQAAQECTRISDGDFQSIVLSYGGRAYRFTVGGLGLNRYLLVYNDTSWVVSYARRGTNESRLTLETASHEVFWTREGTVILVDVGGRQHRIEQGSQGVVRAPSPAMVLDVRVAEGDVVQEKSVLVVLEAMKMEMSVCAPCAGRVREIPVHAQSQVEAGAVLVTVVPESAESIDSGVDTIESPLRDATSCGDRSLEVVLAYLSGYNIWQPTSEDVQVVSQMFEKSTDVSSRIWEVIALQGNLAALHSSRPIPSVVPSTSFEELFVAYLRQIDVGVTGLPKALVSRLETVLAFYRTSPSRRSTELEDSLGYAQRAWQRRFQSMQIVRALLGSLLKSDAMYHDEEGIRRILRVLGGAVSEHFPTVTDLCQELAFRYSRSISHSVTTGETQLAVGCQESAQPASVAPCFTRRLLECLSSNSGQTGEGLILLLTDMYRQSPVECTVLGDSSSGLLVEALFQDGATRLRVWAVACFSDEIDVVLSSLLTVIKPLGDNEESCVELFFPERLVASVDLDSLAKRVLFFFSRVTTVATLGRVTLSCVRSENYPLLSSLSFRCVDGVLTESMVVRGIHPLDARRYELERLKCFSLELVGVRDGTFVIKATARDNHRDERLFGFGEVRQLVATESSDGQVQALPELEKKYFAVLGLFRLFQLNRPSRSRLYWNRITINVEPPTSLSPQSVRPVVERLDESSKGLGIEKVVIRLRHKASDTKQEQPLALSFANRSGTGMKVRIGAPSTRPIRTLCPREQRIIKARRLDLIHPSEVLATLVNQSDEEHTGFPRGDFQEYELSHDDNGLRPVHRDFGDNEANVVVGLIRNFTEKHPAGMLRVVIFGDPSREMGALAEPECRRIIAAIDLAERLKVPVEWFAVSSGARIAMDVGTEGLDWVARVLRRIVTFTEQDGEVNVIVTGVNVGGQSYWNAEATMLMHTRGILVMTEKAAMVLTGKRALDYSGGVSASSNQGIGGADRIMGPNGQAQYVVRDVAEACRVLFQHYDHTYVASGEESPRRFETRDPVTRDIRDYPLAFTNESGLQTVGDIFSAAKNPDRKKPFDMRSLMGAVIDQDSRPLERFARMRNADSAIVWDAHFGGYPATLIGIESRPLPRLGLVPGDGPTSWTGGTLFPVSSKKVARAIHAASGNRPLVVLANLSGFDGSPESMRELQLEYGAEIGKAIVDFRGPIVFCVVSRYHGGAYVVFSHALSENLEVLAVEGSCASVIGGAPAAAVVFTAEVRARTAADPRVVAARRAVDTRDSSKRLELVTIAEETSRVVFAEKQAEVAREFDAVHSVARAVEVGSVHRLIAVANLREELITAIERGIAKARLVPVNKASREWKETRLMTVRNLTSSEEVL